VRDPPSRVNNQSFRFLWRYRESTVVEGAELVDRHGEIEDHSTHKNQVCGLSGVSNFQPRVHESHHDKPQKNYVHVSWLRSFSYTISCTSLLFEKNYLGMPKFSRAPHSSAVRSAGLNLVVGSRWSCFCWWDISRYTKKHARDSFIAFRNCSGYFSPPSRMSIFLYDGCGCTERFLWARP